MIKFRKGSMHSISNEFRDRNLMTVEKVMAATRPAPKAATKVAAKKVAAKPAKPIKKKG